MQGKSNLVTTIEDYSNLYVQNLTFCFHDLELDLMTLVLKLVLEYFMTYCNSKNKAATKRTFLIFGCHDLELDPMTLVLKLDLDIVVTY